MRKCTLKSTLKAGFSLVEILIVILIIALLMAFIIPSVMRGPQAGRDVVRISHVSQIATALESYRSARREYPVIGSSKCLDPNTGVGKELIGAGILTADKFPLDPDMNHSNNGCPGQYYVNYVSVDNVPNAAVIVAAKLEASARATAEESEITRPSLTSGDTFGQNAANREYYHQVSGL